MNVFVLDKIALKFVLYFLWNIISQNVFLLSVINKKKKKINNFSRTLKDSIWHFETFGGKFLELKTCFADFVLPASFKANSTIYVCDTNNDL